MRSRFGWDAPSVRGRSAGAWGSPTRRRPAGPAGNAWAAPLSQALRARQVHRRGRQGARRPVSRVRARERAARLPAEVEHGSEDGHDRAADVRQEPRLSQSAQRRRHQVSVGDQPPPRARHARAGVASHARAEIPRRLSHAARFLAAGRAVSIWRQLVQQPRARDPAHELVVRVAPAGLRRTRRFSTEKRAPRFARAG